MSAIQIGTLCFLLLCARAWPAATLVPLTAVLWRAASCAFATLVITILCIALLLQPLALLPLQWLVGAAVAGIAATVMVGTASNGAHDTGDAERAAPPSPRVPLAMWPILVGAGLLPLLAALPDPFALDATMPQALAMLMHGGRATIAMLVLLAAFGGLCNHAGRRPGAAHMTDGERLAMVAVLALPIIGFAPWLGAA